MITIKTVIQLQSMHTMDIHSFFMVFIVTLMFKYYVRVTI